MSYREPPPLPPLVVTSDKLVQAFDTATGRLLWERETSGSGYTRVATTGETVVVSVGEHAIVLEVSTGRVLSDLQLWFGVRTVVAEGTTIVLAGDRGLACFGPTGYVWGIRATDAPGGFLTSPDFNVEDAQGRVVATLPRYCGFGANRGDFGLALGRAVGQPDALG
jgi:outer membrane protein assembly factor BamB